VSALDELTRREALRVLAAVGLWPLACGDAQPEAAAPPEVAKLVALRPDAGAAARVGREWLAAQTAAPSTAELVQQILPDPSLSGGALREALERAHRSDLEAQRYEAVAGWSLSRTEARLYALLARVGG
jgi:hypothetical protein